MSELLPLIHRPTFLAEQQRKLVDSASDAGSSSIGRASGGKQDISLSLLDFLGFRSPWDKTDRRLYFPRPVEQIAAQEDAVSSLSAFLTQPAAPPDQERQGVLLRGQPGAGTTTAMRHAYFDCLLPEVGADAPVSESESPCWLDAPALHRDAVVSLKSDLERSGLYIAKESDNAFESIYLAYALIGLATGLLKVGAAIETAIKADDNALDTLQRIKFYCDYSDRITIFCDLKDFDRSIRDEVLGSLCRFQQAYKSNHRIVIPVGMIDQNPNSELFSELGIHGFSESDRDRYLENLGRVWEQTVPSDHAHSLKPLNPLQNLTASQLTCHAELLRTHLHLLAPSKYNIDAMTAWCRASTSQPVNDQHSDLNRLLVLSQYFGEEPLPSAADSGPEPGRSAGQPSRGAWLFGKVLVRLLQAEPETSSDNNASIAVLVPESVRGPDAEDALQRICKGILEYRQECFHRLVDCQSALVKWIEARSVLCNRIETTSVDYFDDIIERWGVYEGIRKIHSSDVTKRNLVFRITRRGLLGPTLSVERLNGYKELLQSPDEHREHWGLELEDFDDPNAVCKRVARYVYEYGSDGLVTSIRAEDYRKQLLWRKTYSSINQARFEIPSAVTRPVERNKLAAIAGLLPSAASQQLVAARKGTSATIVRYNYGADGLTTSVVFFDDEGNHKPNAIGIFGYLDRHDQFGRVIERTYLGLDGHAIACKHGVAGWKVDHDSSGYAFSDLDPDGNPCTNKWGVASGVSKFDSVGNLVSRRFFDELGKPTTHADGNHGFDAEYDKHGNRIFVRYIGIDGKTTADKNGTAETRYEYDTAGRIESLRVLDEFGSPTTHTDGHHGLHRMYDANGNLTSERYVDIDGRSTVTKYGYAKACWTYDRLGRMRTSRLFDGEDKPTTHIDGYHGVDLEYDARGNQTVERYVGFDGERSMSKDGYAEARWTFNELGDQLSVRYFDESGDATTHVDGEHGWKAEYDERGNKTCEQYIGVDEEPTTIKAGYSKARMTYEEIGRCTSVRYFDTVGEPSTDADGVHWIRTTYFEIQNAELESYFGRDGKPIPGSYCAETIKTTRDRFGNAIAYRYLNENGEPINGSDGSHGYDVRYDSRGNHIWAQHVDVSNSPANANDGSSEQRIERNGHGRIVRAWFFDASSNPAIIGIGIHGYECHYDSWGNEVSKIFLGVDGKPTQTNLGYAEERRQYTSLGRLASEHFFDTQGNEVTSSNTAGTGGCLGGIHGRLIEYDKKGNATVERFVGIDGMPTLNHVGFAETRSTYDRLGRQISTRSFDATGRAALLNGVFHGLEMEYDSRGNMVTTTYIGLDGKITECSSRRATKRMVYDHRSRLIKESYFDSKGAPTAFFGSFGVEFIYGRHQLEKTVFVDDRGAEIQPNGVVVITVGAHSNAEISGILVGDRIVYFNSKRIRDIQELTTEIKLTSQTALEKVTVVVERNGRSIQLVVDKGRLGVTTAQFYGHVTDPLAD